MGYFNPITYFIKSFIRLFTRKFFWVLLILILIFVGFILYNKGVFAQTSESRLNSILANAYLYLQENDLTDFDYYLITEPNSGTGNGTIIFVNNPSNLYVYSSGNYSNYLAGKSIVAFDYSLSSTSDTYDTVFNNSTNLNNYAYTPLTTYSILYINYDLYYDNGTLYKSSDPFLVAPYFITTNDELKSFDFDYFKISGGTTPYYTELATGVGGSPTFRLQYIYNGVTTNIDVTDYVSVTNDNYWSINIPYNVLTSSVIVRNDNEFSYTFYYEPYYGSSYSVTTGTLKYNIADPSKINEDAQRQLEENQLKATQETTQATKDLQNSITDSNVENITSDTLPSDNTTDITADGVNGIFNSIYNAFCTGEAQDIVFPIPFTDKNITLSPTYVSDMLSNNGAGFIITLIQAFWWYLISRFIIKDVMSKINKIKSGNIEKIETTNIRGDML